MNIPYAKKILASLTEKGITEICLCSGARNAPFVQLLSEPSSFKVFRFFDERSAAFYALGRMKANTNAVAVITTSGTAVAELLPATIEAYYSGLPLVLVTADRPKSYRDSGAPQTIKQIGIFSHYISQSWDLDVGSEFELDFNHRPVHVNVCFPEPLLDGGND